VGGSRYRGVLYDLMLEYPLRDAKGLRPALCIAVCRGLGGRLADALPTAAVLELYHNAFLVHDDVEDGSRLRRGKPTLHEAHGVPVAINVGDGMMALSLQPLLDNTRRVGLGRALQVLELVSTMCRESVEGQALELDWIRAGRFDLGDRDYLEMVRKKTAWYTFVAPMLAGAALAGAARYPRSALRRFATVLGIAFQIQDDLLNLDGDEHAYGKEIAGDLEEGKRTLMVLHLMRVLEPEERRRAEAVLRTPRGAHRVEDLRWLQGELRRRGSIDYGRALAQRYAQRARSALRRLEAHLHPSVHREFLESIVEYTVARAR